MREVRCCEGAFEELRAAGAPPDGVGLYWCLPGTPRDTVPPHLPCLHPLSVLQLDPALYAAARLRVYGGSIVQPAYQDADSTSTALHAAAPVGVKRFRMEKLVMRAS